MVKALLVKLYCFPSFKADVLSTNISLAFQLCRNARRDWSFIRAACVRLFRLVNGDRSHPFLRFHQLLHVCTPRKVSGSLLTQFSGQKS
jgi:hypothetical protein